MGYYIEVRKTHLSKVPGRYVRKQTLKGVERYTTPELQRIEYRIKDAEARIREVEEAIYREVLREVEGKRAALQENARLIGLLDAVTTLAEVAALRGYVRPAVDEGDEIMIEDGRHPVLDGSDFVPNDVYLNTRDHRLIILTGPNMAGKSTYLRQIAHIVIMAQMGSFVPASRARIGIVDRIYTRVGASDDIIRGRSTFMVEMIEVANIINSATPRSLILLDEVGRGTSTFDGLSIAWAVSEYIHDHIRARTVFATHYHQLIELERFLEGAKNYHMAVAQDGEKLIFLRKVRRGGMSESYGIEVARMAGLPRTVVERAKEVLEKIERENALVVRRGGVRAVQTVLFGEVTREHPAVLKLREIDPLRVTPLQALELLFELRKIAEE
jgi:DNA mismatch repair protein MutS